MLNMMMPETCMTCERRLARIFHRLATNEPTRVVSPVVDRWLTSAKKARVLNSVFIVLGSGAGLGCQDGPAFRRNVQRCPWFAPVTFVSRHRFGPSVSVTTAKQTMCRAPLQADTEHPKPNSDRGI